MTKIKDLEREINAIKERNRRVEADKAWEASGTRKVLIAVLTYIVVVIFFYFVGIPRPFVNSIVPTIGFILSTLTIPVVKKIWLKYR